MTNEQREANGQWHLSKKVPVALFIGLIIQTLVVTYVGSRWMESVDSAVTDHERRIVDLEQVDDDRADEMNIIEGRLSRLEANGAAQLETLRRIENTLERVVWSDRPQYNPQLREGELP